MEESESYSGECWFNLGLALMADGQKEEAYDAFYKATWSAETTKLRLLLAGLSGLGEGAYEDALDFASKSMLRNWHNMRPDP